MPALLGNANGFKKGHTPWNKGIKSCTNTGRTHFKKGFATWNKGVRELKEKVCEVCGKTFVKPYGFNIGRWKKVRFCSTKCSSVGNGSWKGGITPINTKIRNGDEYKTWAKTIKERDKYECQICGEVGGKLRSHHIKTFSAYPKLRFDVDNGVTICEGCDQLWVMGREKSFEDYFKFNLLTRRMPWPRLSTL